MGVARETSLAPQHAVVESDSTLLSCNVECSSRRAPYSCGGTRPASRACWRTSRGRLCPSKTKPVCAAAAAAALHLFAFVMVHSGGCVLLSACVTVGNEWLKQQFSVSSIPALVVLDRDGRAQRVPARRSRPVQCTHEHICTMQPHWAATLNAMPATVLGNHDDSHTLLCGCADERRRESAARRSDRSSLPVGRNGGHDSGARTEVGALDGANDCKSEATCSRSAQPSLRSGYHAAGKDGIAAK